jgi:hypothetical protein
MPPARNPVEAAQRAARVAELNERCRRFNHLQTRDRFDSDEAFLAYAEPMEALLYPRGGRAQNVNAGARAGGGGGGGRSRPSVYEGMRDIAGREIDVDVGAEEGDGGFGGFGDYGDAEDDPFI